MYKNPLARVMHHNTAEGHGRMVKRWLVAKTEPNRKKWAGSSAFLSAATATHQGFAATSTLKITGLAARRQFAEGAGWSLYFLECPAPSARNPPQYWPIAQFEIRFWIGTPASLIRFGRFVR